VSPGFTPIELPVMLTFEPCETWHWMQFGRLTPAELFRFERWR
jgi:hypothetical protein